MVVPISSVTQRYTQQTGPMNRETSALLIFLVFVGNICIVDSQQEQSSDISNTGSDEQVHHYSNETIDKYRTVTFDYATGEMTYQSDEEVIRILEKVRRTNSSFLYSSLDQNVAGSNNSRSARVRRTVFPPDGRVLISSTSCFPYSAIGQYYTRIQCTLFLVGPYHALTAAHCVYDRTSREFMPFGYAYIGRTCNVNGTRVSVQNVIVHNSYINDGLRSFDFAYLLLNNTDINSPDYLPFGYRDPMPTVSMTMCGYPGDKPAGCMYCGTCNDAQLPCTTPTTCNDERIQYTCDSAVGMSGGPAYIQETATTLRVYGLDTQSDTNVNYASRISKYKFLNLCQWLINDGYNPNCTG